MIYTIGDLIAALAHLPPTRPVMVGAWRDGYYPLRVELCTLEAGASLHLDGPEVHHPLSAAWVFVAICPDDALDVNREHRRRRDSRAALSAPPALPPGDEDDEEEDE